MAAPDDTATSNGLPGAVDVPVDDRGLLDELPARHLEKKVSIGVEAQRLSAAVAVDGAGEAFITGATDATDFPTT